MRWQEQEQEQEHVDCVPAVDGIDEGFTIAAAISFPDATAYTDCCWPPAGEALSLLLHDR